jgi:hypothetical protein
MVGSAAAAAPVNTIPPEVSGSPLVGEILVCHPGSWTGNATFSYVWLREGQEVAEGGTYIVTNADRGYYISCITIAKNGAGEENEEAVESSNSLLIPGEHGEPPVNHALPAISPETAVVGTTLSCSQGTWSGNPAPTFGYQWFRDETAIPEATATSYKVATADAGHSLSCKVTATNSAGFATATSENSVVVSGIGLKNEVPPSVGGNPEVREQLTCHPGTWSGSPAPTFKYQWLRDKVAITSATASVYTVVEADETHSLSCKVTAENGQGSPVTVESSNALKVSGTPPENKVAPHIAGTVEVGEQLTCEKGTWTGTPTPGYTYLWLIKNGVAIAGATKATYIIPGEDRGSKLTCEVTGSNEVSSETVASAAVVVPEHSGGGGKPKNTEAPRVVGMPTNGATVECNPGKWTGSPEYTYQWRLNKGNISGEVEATFTVQEADEGGELSCLVTAFNSEGSVQLETSPVHVPGLAPRPTAKPNISGAPVVGETLTCSSGNWEGAPAPTFTYTWLLGGTTVGSTNSYVVVAADRGQSLTCRVTATNDEGHGESSAEVLIPGKAPLPKELPSVSGTPAVGDPLTCDPGVWTGEPAPTFTYQWLLDGVPIPSATGTQYPIVSGDIGRSLSCEVTGTNAAGSDPVYSNAVHIPGGAPVNVTLPEVLGAPVVGETLTCSRGTWTAKPAPAFSYQWLRDGSVVATGEGYKVELADQGHSFSCAVTATNTEGSATAQSASVTIPAALVKTKTETGTSSTGSGSQTKPPPTATEILSRLGAQLASAQRRTKIGSLLKDGATWFHFTAPASGTLELYWYEVPKGAHVSSAKSKPLPVLVATTTASFSGATLKTVALHLTNAGRALLKKTKRITLTAKGVFALPGGISVTWIKTFVLTR